MTANKSALQGRATDGRFAPEAVGMFAKAAAPLVEGWYRLRDVGNF
jgi:hypothetical protein